MPPRRSLSPEGARRLGFASVSTGRRRRGTSASVGSGPRGCLHGPPMPGSPPCGWLTARMSSTPGWTACARVQALRARVRRSTTVVEFGRLLAASARASPRSRPAASSPVRLACASPPSPGSCAPHFADFPPLCASTSLRALAPPSVPNLAPPESRPSNPRATLGGGCRAWGARPTAGSWSGPRSRPAGPSVVSLVRCPLSPHASA